MFTGNYSSIKLLKMSPSSKTKSSSLEFINKLFRYTLYNFARIEFKSDGTIVDRTNIRDLAACLFCIVVPVYAMLGIGDLIPLEHITKKSISIMFNAIIKGASSLVFIMKIYTFYAHANFYQLFCKLKRCENKVN